MRINEAFSGKYFAAADLEQPLVVVMANVEIQDVGQDAPDRKPVVYFHGQGKGLVLNQTNFKTLADLHGAESDEWAGKQCELYQTTTEFKGKTVPCVRIRAAQNDDQMIPRAVAAAQRGSVQVADPDGKLQREADAAEGEPVF